MINTGHSELLYAFKAHSKFSKSNLLLFYTVECGLKYLYLRSNKTPRMQTTNDFEIRNHDLTALISHCKLPKQITIKNECRTKRDPREIIPLLQIHQAWRYGVVLLPEDEKLIVDGLNNLVTYIKGKIQS